MVVHISRTCSRAENALGPRHLRMAFGWSGCGCPSRHLERERESEQERESEHAVLKGAAVSYRARWRRNGVRWPRLRKKSDQQRTITHSQPPSAKPAE